MDEYIKREEAIAALTEFCYDQTVSKYLSLDHCLVARDAIERAIKVLESLPAADVEPVQEWVSVKERLPQENEPEGTLCENVQVLLNNGKVSVGWCNRRTKLWWHMEYDEDYFISKDYDHTPVIAWQPLAQPPKGE